MTFEEWVEQQEFWKSDTSKVFSPIWTLHDEKGYPPAEIASILDTVVSAMRSEYGE